MLEFNQCVQSVFIRSTFTPQTLWIPHLSSSLVYFEEANVSSLYKTFFQKVGLFTPTAKKKNLDVQDGLKTEQNPCSMHHNI